MKFKDFFVIGTDTDVGKTYVSTLLYKALKKHNFQYYKPIQSGCFLKDGKLTAPDVDFLTRFVGIDYDDSMVTYTLKEEVSPHLASEMEGTTIEIENVKKHFEDLKKKYSNILVEGAGGLYVPLIRDKFYIYDLIKLFNLPVVLVCGTKVGAINHTMLTLNALNTMGIKLQGLVFNNYKGQFFEDDNIKVILELSKIEIKDILEISDKELDEAFDVIHSLEPYGVGAYSLEECLKLQLKVKNLIDDKLFLFIENYLYLLADKKYDLIKEKLNINDEQLFNYIDIIKSLMN